MIKFMELKNLSISFFGLGQQALRCPPPKNIAVLDVLRSIAILLVVGGHIVGEYLHFYEPNFLTGLPVFYYGWIGVDLFFVLSGFLIGQQIWKEYIRSGNIDIPRFLIRRGLRIWPLFYAVYFLILAFNYQFHTDWQRAWPDLVFLSNYKQGIVSGAWSLATEEQFYILFPVLFCLVLRRFHLDKHLFLLLALYFSLPFIRWLIVLTAEGPVSIGNQSILNKPIHTHCDGLVAGLMLAWISQCRPGWLKKWHWSKNLVVLMATGTIALLLRNYNDHVFAFFSLSLIFGSWVFCSLKDNTIFSRIASWRGFFVLSRLSYGMYLNHFEVLPRIVPFLSRYFKSDITALFFILIISVASSVFVAWITYILIEHPFLELREVIIKQWHKSGDRVRVAPILRSK
jgi:peptidoglycan/LPS O-acetylase OafA/YrhL